MPSWGGGWSDNSGRGGSWDSAGKGGGKGRGGGGGGGGGRGGGRGGGDSQDYQQSSRRPQGDNARGGGGGHYYSDEGDEAETVRRLENQISGFEREYEQALRKMNEKSSEKFDLIFGILRELQDRQARLEESLSGLVAAGGASSSSAWAGGGPGGGGCMAMQGCGGYNNCDGGMWAMGGNYQFNSGQQFGNGWNGNQMGYNGSGGGKGGAMMQQQQFTPDASQAQGSSSPSSSQQPQQQQQQQPQPSSASDQNGAAGAAEVSPSRWQPKRPPGSQSEGAGGQSPGGGGDAAWSKVRVWKVVNLPDDQPRALAVTSRAEAYAPGSGRTPPEDGVVVWLQNGDTLKQVGHSKKKGGHMIMPVHILRSAETPAGGGDGEAVEGWVTRRLVGNSPGPPWFEEVKAEEDGNGDEE